MYGVVSTKGGGRATLGSGGGGGGTRRGAKELVDECEVADDDSIAFDEDRALSDTRECNEGIVGKIALIDFTDCRLGRGFRAR